VPEPQEPAEISIDLQGRGAPADVSGADWILQSRSRELVQLPRPEVVEAEEPDDARRSDVDHWGRSEHLRALTRRVYDPVYRYWFRTEWEGLERMPREGGALLVANHAGAIPSDAPAIMHGIETELGRPVYGMAEYLFRSLPVIGTLWSRGGGVPAHPDNAYRLLHDEQQLALVFPEGARRRGRRSPSAISCAGSAGAASSRSRCVPACLSCHSRSSAPRSRCRSSSRARDSRSC
jgi:1-acyl-sn-glycerol-3-phosphate acyltransferase